MVGDHEAGALESLGLVDQHVAPLVVCIIGHHHPSFQAVREERGGEKMGKGGGGGRESE